MHNVEEFHLTELSDFLRSNVPWYSCGSPKINTCLKRNYRHTKKVNNFYIKKCVCITIIHSQWNYPFSSNDNKRKRQNVEVVLSTDIVSKRNSKMFKLYYSMMHISEIRADFKQFGDLTCSKYLAYFVYI